MADVRLHHRTVKSVLRRSKLVDPFFVGKYSFSPYHACAHGCSYCDGRAEKYWVEGEFDRDIVVRRNAAAVLEVETRRLRERGIVFVGSGVSDAYQPPEIAERLMPACGRILADRGLPVTILTKSGLVVRDLDLWTEVNDRSGFLLMVSLMTLDDRLRALFEPSAGTVDERLETLRAFRARGCAVGVAAMPLLPFLADGDAEVDSLAGCLAEAGADFVLSGGLTLRPGRQKEAFFLTLRHSFPDLVPRYEDLYAENRPSGAPRSAYARERHARAVAAFARAGLSTTIPHRIYHGRIPVYDEVHVLLHQMSQLYGDHRRQIHRLESARDRYRDWLLESKRVYGRRRSTEVDLSWNLRRLASSDAWADLLGNPRLASFLREIVIEERIFDERTRRLA